MGGQKNSNWFISWGWIVLVVILIIALVTLIAFVIKNVNEKKIKEQTKKINFTFLEIFGGESNIVSCESKGSRLILVLKDYDKLDEVKLKENGITSLIKATNKITFIVGEKSKELESFINSLNK